MCLEHVFEIDNVGAERMCSGRLFQATGPATENAQLPSCSLFLVSKTRSLANGSFTDDASKLKA